MSSKPGRGVFRRAGGLIYDFLLLSCGIRLLMFQPCLDRILICLIWSLIFYTDDVCKGMLHNEDLLHVLRESHYDVLFSDPMMPCTDLMAQTLNIPHVLLLRLTFAYTFERLCGQMPAPPSYVPAAALHDHLTDHMSFTERVENMLIYIIHTTIFRLNMKFTFDTIYTEIWGNYFVLATFMH